jgi:DNA repair protein SbcD/Mre11
MKILHTADWHLGDRLGRIDRTADLQRAVEQVARYCHDEQVEVLLIAGDVFSELSRPEGLRQSIEHFRRVFGPFLLGGGTIIALTGNHDNDNFCQTLRHALSLAAPAADQDGALLCGGRFHLATQPTFFRLMDRDRHEVQFILMPYPTASRYLDDPGQRFASLDEKNRALQAGFSRKLQAIAAAPAYRAGLPTVLAAHIHMQGAALPTLFRISEGESVVFGENDLPGDFAYVALGHIHKPQFLGGRPHVRYSGSIERLDLGERHDQKSVVVVDIGPDGCRGLPRELPLEATPIYEIEIADAKAELPELRNFYPDAERALVRYQLKYRAGTDNLEELLRELDGIFPRWYDRDWCEAGDLGTARGASPTTSHKSFRDTVLDYLKEQLDDHADGEAVRLLAEDLLAEEAG